MNFNAFAKINLFLKVLSSREDGYHQISTLFERINLSDSISIEINKKSTIITCDNPKVPTGEGSLLMETVKAFNRATEKETGFDISVGKKIPIAAGLGGGSSDAAAILNGMNEITGKPLSRKRLLEIGKDLGADIPFFISNCRFGFGTERGDIIQEAETGVELQHILIKASFDVSTKDVYDEVSAFNLTKDRGVDRMFNAFLKENDVTSLTENLCNDLQAIVLRKFPVLDNVFLELKKAGAKGVLLSGSGPTIFGIFDKEEIGNAENKLRERFPAEKNWEVYKAKTQ